MNPRTRRCPLQRAAQRRTAQKQRSHGRPLPPSALPQTGQANACQANARQESLEMSIRPIGDRHSSRHAPRAVASYVCICTRQGCGCLQQYPPPPLRGPWCCRCRALVRFGLATGMEARRRLPFSITASGSSSSRRRLGVLHPIRHEGHVGRTRVGPGPVPDLSDIEAARDDLVARGAEASEVFHEGTPGARFQHAGPDGRVSGPAPKSYGSFVSFSDPDGNSWLFQEVTTRLPGRVDPAATSFGSASDLADAMRGRRPPTASTRSASARPTRIGPTGTPSTWWRSRPGRSCRRERLRRDRSRRWGAGRALRCGAGGARAARGRG